jgi:hypothetical protein
MEKALTSALGAAHETDVRKERVVRVATPGHNSLILLGCLLAWLVMGGFLSWLIGDFSRAYNETNSTAISLLIFSMFFMTAVVVALIRWSSFRGHSRR